jgi:hypothetical protein
MSIEEKTLVSESAAHDRLNAELVQLMRQQTGTDAKEVEVMGRTFLVLPEVFNVSTYLPFRVFWNICLTAHSRLSQKNSTSGGRRRP